MNFLEFESAIEKIGRTIIGTQLQDFSVQDKDILLLFYNTKPCILRLSFRAPPVLFFETESFKLKRDPLKIPLTLFLSKHFLRGAVLEIRHQNSWGRRFEIIFTDERKMEVVLVPGYQNVGLFIKDDRKEKKIYWNKPKDLPESVVEAQSDVADFRSIDAIRDEWYAEVQSDAKGVVQKNWQGEVEKKIRKKTEAIDKIKEQAAENKSVIERLYGLGEQLKYKTSDQLENVDRDWLKSMVRDLDRETVFKKAKSLSGKSEGMQHRIDVLRNEIRLLNDSLLGPRPESKHKISIAGKAEVATRKLEVSSSLSLYMGKNAKDNVQLLKNSQPWELWFHLKDYPSAYAITRRNKTEMPTHADLIKMSVWFAKECFKNRKEKATAIVDVIYTECRFVKLLKGDKMGRVTYTNGKNLRVSIA